MKKFVSVALAALALGGAAIAGPASAEPRSGWHGGGGWHEGWRGDRGVGVVGAGLLGLAVGSAIAAPHAYYAPRPAYYGCASHWAWDRYLGAMCGWATATDARVASAIRNAACGDYRAPLLRPVYRRDPSPSVRTR